MRMAAVQNVKEERDMTYQEILEFISEHKAEYDAWMAAQR